MRCDERRLERVLSTAEDDSAEFRETARHIETCPRCRERIAAMSATEGLLSEACETLRGSGQPTFDPAAGSRSIAIALESLLGDDNAIDCETVSLDFLEPARHPEMLGRVGRYDVDRLIGAGGMGVVLKGFDSELHRVVAIKVLLPHLANSSSARRRFAREAKAAAAVMHEHVIPIYNVESDGPLPYLVMQYVPGQSLQARVDEHGPLEIKEVLRIAQQAAAGLAAAHAQGVVHRDVKPANILLEESVDRVILSDFGLARTVDDATLTRTGVLAGTPHYMSPEQASGGSVDQRSDLFSLGSVIYFMCTGRPPYRADSPMAVLNSICHEPHRPVDEVNSDVPYELAELVDRLLAKKPAERYASAQEVDTHCAALLAALQQGRRSRRRPQWQSWLRGVWRRRSLAKRMTFGTIAAVLCMLAGAWIAHVITGGDRDPIRLDNGADVAAPLRSEVEAPRQIAVAQATQSIQAPPTTPVPTKPIPDTFAQDLLQTKRALEVLEAESSQPKRSDDPFTSARNTQWVSNLAQLYDALSRMVSLSKPPEPIANPGATPGPQF